MKLLCINLPNIKIKLSCDEAETIHQALNEVCNGLYVRNFEQKIGCSNETASSLMQKIKDDVFPLNTFNEDPMFATPIQESLEFSSDQLLIIYNSLQVVCKELDLFEFETRMGVELDQVNLLIKELGSIVDTIKPSKS